MTPTRNPLANGLRVLQLLVDADEARSATDLARTAGMHQSSVSRILQTLAEAGFARKVGPHRFAPDYGALALGSAAIDKFALAHLPRQAMAEAADRAPGHVVSLSILWRDQILYFLRSRSGREQTVFDADGWPLHLSAPGLLLMLGLEQDSALTLLDRSRQRFGWATPGPAVPDSPQGALTEAGRAVDHECLVLDDWQAEGQRTAAITLDLPGDSPPVALSIAGPSDAAALPELRLWLHTARRSVEAAMTL